MLAAITCFFLNHTTATAQRVEDFYRGKTITIYVGTGIGAGAVSAYPMAFMIGRRIAQNRTRSHSEFV